MLIVRSGRVLWLIFALFVASCVDSASNSNNLSGAHQPETAEAGVFDSASYNFPIPDINEVKDSNLRREILYGKELFVNTEVYLGPKGSVMANNRNEMRCQNCHLDAGTRKYCMPMTTVHGRYPQYRAREDRVLTILDRINNCITRPLQGRALPLGNRELAALSLYIKWLGEGRPAGEKPEGYNYGEIKPIPRAADTAKGRLVYIEKCQVCHQADGQGLKKEGGYGYEYPPVWGEYSYTLGSSMHRMLKAAAFIKHNMPYGVRYDRPLLSDEEAFDVTAFINSERLNHRVLEPTETLYPNIATKPVDFPFGPYADSFSEFQHRYGPFQPIIDFYKAQ